MKNKFLMSVCVAALSTSAFVVSTPIVHATEIASEQTITTASERIAFIMNTYFNGTTVKKDFQYEIILKELEYLQTLDPEEEVKVAVVNITYSYINPTPTTETDTEEDEEELDEEVIEEDEDYSIDDEDVTYNSYEEYFGTDSTDDTIITEDDEDDEILEDENDVVVDDVVVDDGINDETENEVEDDEVINKEEDEEEILDDVIVDDEEKNNEDGDNIVDEDVVVDEDNVNDDENDDITDEETDNDNIVLDNAVIEDDENKEDVVVDEDEDDNTIVNEDDDDDIIEDDESEDDLVDSEEDKGDEDDDDIIEDDANDVVDVTTTVPEDTSTGNTSNDAVVEETVTGPVLYVDNYDSYLITLYNNWDDNLKQYAWERSQEMGVEYTMVLAIIYGESRFQSDATHLNTNGTTDWGLMQINDVCLSFVSARVSGVETMEDLLDPYKNIEAGIQILKYHKDATGNDKDALMRYQLGEGNYAKYKAEGIETTTYTETVCGYQDIFIDAGIS